VTIAAGIVGDGVSGIAGRTNVNMAAEFGRAASFKTEEDQALSSGSHMRTKEFISVEADDVSDFEART
jgi:hypothetical protein